MEINLLTLEQALEALGQLLMDRGYHYEVVAIGGGGLLLLGQIDRSTKDLDLVAMIEKNELISADPLPPNFVQAVEETGKALELGKEWVNIGPASLLEMGLPLGFKTRMQTRLYGGLTLHLAGRLDQVCFKLYAAVDQGPHSKHFADLKSLQPTSEELQFAKEWCTTQDASDGFINELEKALLVLRVRHANS